MTLSKVEEALILAATTFREYEVLHKNKATKDGILKAMRNAKIATTIEQALTELTAYNDRLNSDEFLLEMEKALEDMGRDDGFDHFREAKAAINTIKQLNETGK